MKVISNTRFGTPDVLSIVEKPTPTPGPNEILIRIGAAAVTPSDTAFRSGKPFAARLAAGPFKPRHQVLGDSLAGEVTAIGANVTRFQIGDRVFGSAGPTMGAHAEFIALPEDAAIVKMPDTMSYAEAAAIADGGLTGLPFLQEKGKIKRGDSVLINGASGAIGVIAVQLAKHFGAEVTGVCGPSNVDLVRAHGADHVIDYTAEDFTRRSASYDIIFDAVGKSSFGKAKNALKPGGRYLTTVPSIGGMMQVLRTAIVGSKKAIFAATGLRKPDKKAEDLRFFATLAETGELRAEVEIVFPFERFADAHRHVDTGHKKGAIVIATDPALAIATAAGEQPS